MSKEYKRVIILGNSGSGKSTLAKKIGDKLQLPVHHMDFHFWGPDWEQPDDEEWREKLLSFLKQENWIIEGGVNNLESRVEACDLVIYLKFPFWFCLYRVIKRYILFMINKDKVFLPVGCRNRLSLEFLQYIVKFPFTRAKKIEEALGKYEDTKGIITLNSPDEVEDFEVTFLKNLKGETEPSATFAP